jgi:hypothetical protein
MEKRKYRGIFNWKGEVITMYRFAYSLKQAKSMMFIALVYRLGYKVSLIRNYFLSGDGDYTIDEIKELEKDKGGI